MKAYIAGTNGCMTRHMTAEVRREPGLTRLIKQEEENCLTIVLFHFRLLIPELTFRGPEPVFLSLDNVCEVTRSGYKMPVDPA